VGNNLDFTLNAIRWVQEMWYDVIVRATVVGDQLEDYFSPLDEL
jgi:hypothetical protein